MDPSKAVDVVPHGILITKFKAYGLTDNACKFMFSYVRGQFKRVHLSNENSSWEPLLKGIARDLDLAPLYLTYLIMIFSILLQKM